MRLKFDKGAIPWLVVIWGCIIGGFVVLCRQVPETESYGWLLLFGGVALGGIRSLLAFRARHNNTTGGADEQD